MDFNNDSGTLANVAVISPPSSTVTFSSTGAVVLPLGSTAQRPMGPTAGTFRYNSDLNKAEVYNGAFWQDDVVNLSECNDVVIATPVSGQLLTYNGTTWVNSSVTTNGTYYVTVSSWTLISGNMYYADVAHNLGTLNIDVTLWDSSTNTLVQADKVVATDVNTIRVTVYGNSHSLRCVVMMGGGGSGVTILRSLTYFASSLDSPNNAGWAVNALAAAIADPTTTSLTVRQFSNTTEQGVGLTMSVPAGATNVTFRFKGRAQTAPGSTAVVQPKLYIRSIPNNAAIGSWSTAYNMSNISIPTNAYFQYSSQTYSIAALGLATNGFYQVELTRAATVSGGTQLASNWYLAELTIEFT
jgi:hypothetical protein